MERATEKRSLKTAFSVAAFAVALIGLADASYLTAKHFSGKNVPCTLMSGCDTVLKSEWSEIFGFPTAMYGAIAYFFAFTIAFLVYSGSESLWKLFGLLASAMFLGSMWFLYLQAFVIQAYCQYCLVSAVTSTLLFLIFIVSLLFRNR